MSKRFEPSLGSRRAREADKLQQAGVRRRKAQEKSSSFQRLLSNIWLGKRRGELKSTTFLEPLMQTEWGSQHCTSPTGASRRQPGDILWIFS